MNPMYWISPMWTLHCNSLYVSSCGFDRADSIEQIPSSWFYLTDCFIEQTSLRDSIEQTLLLTRSLNKFHKVDSIKQILLRRFFHADFIEQILPLSWCHSEDSIEQIPSWYRFQYRFYCVDSIISLYGFSCANSIPCRFYRADSIIHVYSIICISLCIFHCIHFTICIPSLMCIPLRALRSAICRRRKELGNRDEGGYMGASYSHLYLYCRRHQCWCINSECIE